ncbi:hypothetical protein PT274_01405 [Leuconostocaceae bacterium ESL0958]|nr:hypothetical protein [Leuconostocaceae bacterium ESL0958]
MDVKGFKNKVTYLRIWSRDDGNMRDVANSATDIQWKTDFDTASELSFSFSTKENFIPSNGDQVTFSWNDQAVFTGWIFKRKVSDDNSVAVTAYSNSRYLKGTGTYVWPASTSAERFEHICNDLQLPYAVLDKSGHKVEEEITDGATFFDIINTALKKTKSATGTRYLIIDAADGTLQHISQDRLASDLLLGDGQGLTSWSMEHSIEDMSNLVQVIHEDSQTKARELRVAKNEDSMKRYGPLVHTESVSGDINVAQLQDKANSLLGEKNGQTKNLRIKALGHISVRAGTSMYITIKEMAQAGLPANQRILVKSCTHDFSTNWTMDLEVTIV